MPWVGIKFKLILVFETNLEETCSFFKLNDERNTTWICVRELFKSKIQTTCSISVSELYFELMF